jgi:hypothetical protein
VTKQQLVHSKLSNTTVVHACDFCFLCAVLMLLHQAASPTALISVWVVVAELLQWVRHLLVLA